MREEGGHFILLFFCVLNGERGSLFIGESTVSNISSKLNQNIKETQFWKEKN